MIRKIAIFAAFFLCAASAGAAPKLLVVISVDQMRSDYLTRFGADFKHGFRTLYQEGAVYTNAHHTHVPTETGPGHAVILTGRTPNINGIVANDWWDRQAERTVYCVEDSAFGRGPEKLLAYTLGDVLKAKNPASKVVSVSSKDRSAILMGGKKADLAAWWDKKTGKFASSLYYGPRPAWIDAFNAKLTVPPGEDVLYTSQADALVLELAEQAIVEHGLGQDEHADILAVSFSAADYIGHKWGPDSDEVKANLIALDKTLGELLKFIEINVGKDFIVALTADHGVIPPPENPSGKAMKITRIMETAVSAQAEKLLQALRPAPGQKWVMGWNPPGLYLNRKLASAQGLDWALFLREAAKALKALEAAADVYVAGEVPAGEMYGPLFDRQFYPGRSGDLLVRVKEGVLLAFYEKGTSHGSPYVYDSHVPLIFWGADFRTGLFSPRAAVADLAPTVAIPLGVPFAAMEGSRPRVEALKEPIKR